MKIPTIYGLSIIFVAISLAFMFHFYNQNKTEVVTRNLDPQNIRTTNITPTSFTVNWFTPTSTVDTLVYGASSNLGSSQNDDRDTTPTARKTHIVTVNNLTPDTTYYYKIRSDTFFFPQSPLTITTPSTFPQTANHPLTGTIGTPAKTTLVDILIFLQTENASDLSTYVDQNSNYIFPLSNLRSSDLKSTITLDPAQSISANILATDSNKNSFILLKLPRIDPIPTLTLGQNLELNNSTSPSLLPLN